MKSRFNFTKTYGENYLAGALIVGAIVYKKYKDGKKIYVEEIIDSTIQKNKLKITEKGKDLLIQTIKKTMRDIKNERY